MTPAGATLLAVAGLAAGAVNAVAGGGSLLSFPALVLVLHHPLAANVTNTVGLLPGYAAGARAYREELRGQRPALTALGPATALGAAVGCAVLLSTPRAAFTRTVPYLVLLAVLLLAAQPWLTRRLHGSGARPRPRVLALATFACGAYAAYFGAAVGVLLLAVLGVLRPDSLQRLNAVKNALSLVAALVGAAVYLALGPVDPVAALVLAAASVLGGRYGAGLARRLPERALRRAILCVGAGVCALMFTRPA